MDVFIRRVPNSTTRLDLLRFINSALKPKWSHLQFSSLGEIKACDICQINNSDNGREEFHGLVRIEPANAALAVIEKLNGECINSQQVQVRKFYHRSTSRDPRSEDDTPAQSVMKDKRDQDRRRPHLVLQSLHSGVIHASSQNVLDTSDTSMA